MQDSYNFNMLNSFIHVKIWKTVAGDTPMLPVTVFQIFAFEMYDEFIRLLEKVSSSKSEKLFHDKDEIILNKCNRGSLGAWSYHRFWSCE